MRANKTTVEQVMTKERKVKTLLQAVAMLVIVLAVFMLDWNIAGLKETKKTVVSETVLGQTLNKKTPQTGLGAVTKKAPIGGCRNASDIVNVNLLMQEIKDFDNFTELLEALSFENGRVLYPEVALNGALLVAIQEFFNKVDVFSKEELDSCVGVLRRAQRYNVARFSFDYDKMLTKTPNAG